MWGDTEHVLKTPAGFPVVQMPPPPVEPIKHKRVFEEDGRFAIAIKFVQHDDLQISCAQMVRVETQGAVQMVQRRGPVISRAINLRQSMVARAGPSLIPRRFIERGVSVFIVTEITQTQA